MASLSSAPCYTKQGLWRGERKLHVSANSQAQASTRRDRELCLSSFTEIKGLSTRRAKLRLLQVAARRSSQTKKFVIEEPLEGEADDDDDEEYVKPDLPGEEPDFWEGPQFELLGLFFQYLPFIGIGIALLACFLAVRYYNEGAADFKETPVYKDAMESQGFVETPSDSKVFDEPPPQDAPPVVEEGSSS